MGDPGNLLENNKKWVESQLQRDPHFFTELAKGQSPNHLWIGCSDSRIPANEVVGLRPGEIFVHRNVANLVVHTDFNLLSVMQYAVDFLHIEHIIVCGHYGCGGVEAAMGNTQVGLADNWLRHIRDVYQAHEKELEKLPDQNARFRRLVELSIWQQVLNVGYTSIVQNAWHQGKPLAIHGWVYDIGDGLIRDLKYDITNQAQLNEIYHLNC